MHIESDTCTDGDIRLTGGSTPSDGIIELCYGGHYGVICTSPGSMNRVIGQRACMDLGFDPAGNTWHQ